VNEDVAELDGGFVIMILEAEVSAHVAAPILAGEDVNESFIEKNGNLIPGGDDFIGVPFANFEIWVKGSLDVVDCSGFLGIGGVSTDLDFVSLLDGNPRVSSRVWEADEDA